MRKIKITTPATSANLGPGFDFLGVAFKLYNVFTFKENNKFSLLGFNGLSKKNNYVYQAYCYLFNKQNEDIVPLQIKLVKNDIPFSHGLGSSSSAIVAGMMAANYFLKNKLTNEELIKEIINYEGHPDNVMPCFNGGLVATINDNGNYYLINEKVSKNLKFTIIIPPYNVSTSDARKALPKQLSYKEVTSNASRTYALKEAFNKGDINLLKIALHDEIHEKYRSLNIKEYKDVKDIVEANNGILTISGSGPSMLVTSLENDKLINILKEKFPDFEIFDLSVDYKGSKLVEVK